MPLSLFFKPTCFLLVIIIVVISIPTVWSEYDSSTIWIPSDLYVISIPTCCCWSRALCPLLLSFSLSLSCSPSTPSCYFFHFLFVSLLPFLFASWVHRSWAWSRCDAGFCDLILMIFNFSGFDWFWWVLDFGGWVRGLIGVALGAGCRLIGVVLGLCYDFVILWFGWFFDVVVVILVGGCGACDMGGWIWWPAA